MNVIFLISNAGVAIQVLLHTLCRSNRKTELYVMQLCKFNACMWKHIVFEGFNSGNLLCCISFFSVEAKLKNNHLSVTILFDFYSST